MSGATRAVRRAHRHREQPRAAGVGYAAGPRIAAGLPI